LFSEARKFGRKDGADFWGEWEEKEERKKEEGLVEHLLSWAINYLYLKIEKRACESGIL